MCTKFESSAAFQAGAGPAKAINIVAFLEEISAYWF
jgi:hypothetical protein